MTLSCIVYGGYYHDDNKQYFRASCNRVQLGGYLSHITLLSGSHITVVREEDPLDIHHEEETYVIITGEYILNDINKKGYIEIYLVISAFEWIADYDADYIYNVIGTDYTTELDGYYTKYITDHGNYCITNLSQYSYFNELIYQTLTGKIASVVMKPYIIDDKTSDGVYSYVKNTIDNISYKMLGKSISTVINELYETPEYIRKGINPTLLYQGPDALFNIGSSTTSTRSSSYFQQSSNDIPALTDEENKQKIKTRMLNDYDKYHYYMFKIPIEHLSHDDIMNLYYDYSRTYYLDILQYEGDILGLYIMGKK